MQRIIRASGPFEPTAQWLKEQGSDAPVHTWAWWALKAVRHQAVESTGKRTKLVGPPSARQVIAQALHPFGRCAPGKLYITSLLEELKLVKLKQKGPMGRDIYWVDPQTDLLGLQRKLETIL